LAARLSLACDEETRSRTHSVRSDAGRSPVAVAATIFSTSSTESRLKVRTPWTWYASAIASAGLTGCMKHRVACGSRLRTRRTSVIEATSYARIPLSHRVRIRSGDGFALTAYIDVPGNFDVKNSAARVAA